MLCEQTRVLVSAGLFIHVHYGLCIGDIGDSNATVPNSFYILCIEARLLRSKSVLTKHLSNQILEYMQ